MPSLSDVIVLRAGRPLNSELKDKTHGPEPAARRERDGESNMKPYSRLQGLVICLAAVAAAVLFLVGIFLKSYWALAVPVAVGLLWLLGLAFWIGWTLLTIKVNPREDRSP